MKRIFNVVVVLAMAVMLGACSMSLDTIKYSMDTDKIVKTAPCVDETIQINEPVMFDYDSAEIRADQIPVIDNIVSLVDECENTKLVIKGHASIEGSVEYNKALSERRAEAVKNALIEKGVSEDCIATVVGDGEVDIFGETLESNRRVIVLNL